MRSGSPAPSSYVTLRILPIQTDVGVFLRIEQDGVELHPVGPLESGVSIDVRVDVPTEEAEPPKNVRREIRRISRRQERRIADGVGGKVQPGSGSIPGKKGDVVRPGDLRIEGKFTYASQYTLRLDTMHKIASEAEGSEVPAVVVHFVDKSSGRTLEELAVLFRSDWEKLVNRKSK